MAPGELMLWALAWLVVVSCLSVAVLVVVVTFSAMVAEAKKKRVSKADLMVYDGRAE